MMSRGFLSSANGGRRTPRAPLAVRAALLSAVCVAVGVAPASAATAPTATTNAWIPLGCLIGGVIPIEVAASLTATGPAWVTPGQTFSLTHVSTDVVVPPAAQESAFIFGAVSEIEGDVSDFETGLTGETFGGSTQVNTVAALQPPNADAPSPADPLINGPSPLAAFPSNGITPPKAVFSFGEIPVTISSPSGNAYGPAPGTGGGPTPTSGTPDPFTEGPFTVTGAAGTNAAASFGDPAAPMVSFNKQPLVYVAANTLFFGSPDIFAPGTFGWAGPIPLSCGIDTTSGALPAPGPGYVSSLSVPIVAAPAVTTQPSNASVAAGSAATFTAAASGTPTPTVQWQVSTDKGSAWTNDTADAGNTSATLTIASAGASQTGDEYRAIFTNEVGSATSDPATLTVTAASSSSPSVTGVFPRRGHAFSLVFITGTNFAWGQSVSFGTNEALAITLDSNLALALAPFGSGTVDVTVKTATGTSAVSSPDHFTYGGFGF